MLLSDVNATEMCTFPSRASVVSDVGSDTSEHCEPASCPPSGTKPQKRKKEETDSARSGFHVGNYRANFLDFSFKAKTGRS